ncbi:MAG: UDP-N-acetylmuramoyl-L-alanine--D-glutamate ligase [Gordonia sp. (in: high G+C Gram-positive bacteria)]
MNVVARGVGAALSGTAPSRTPELQLAGLRVLVAGGGVAGMSAARYLLDAGAVVVIADDRLRGDSDVHDAAGADFTSVAALLADRGWLQQTDLVVTSPGFAPANPLLVAARDAAIPVWGEVELAWRVDRAGLLGPPRTWLVVTGTNGKTTTTSMLTEIVSASGRSAAACGNIGLPVLDAMRATPRVEVLCAELSSFQLYWAPSVAPDAGVVLNVADDHLDWHGSFEAYAAAKTVALHGTIGVVGLDDPVASRLPVRGRRIGFTLGVPQPGELGVVDGELVDRAFVGQPTPDGRQPPDGHTLAGRSLVAAADISPAGPSGIADALAAAALALTIGVTPATVAAALTAFRPGAHRGEVVATLDGIDFVDDSKATNPHAAQAAVGARRRVVLIAGGLLKGASVDGLVAAVADRLAGVVVIGRDRDLIVEAIARHAPKVPTVTVFTGDDGVVKAQRATGPELGSPTGGPVSLLGTSTDPAVAVMEHAVTQAWRLAVAAAEKPDAILLAPAAASLDMFAGYGRRGDAFAAAAKVLVGSASVPRP